MIRYNLLCSESTGNRSKGLPTCKTKTRMPKLPKTALAVFDSLGQFWTIVRDSHVSFRHRPTSVRLVLANQMPPFSLIAMHRLACSMQAWPCR